MTRLGHNCWLILMILTVSSLNNNIHEPNQLKWQLWQLSHLWAMHRMCNWPNVTIRGNCNRLFLNHLSGFFTRVVFPNYWHFFHLSLERNIQFTYSFCSILSFCGFFFNRKQRLQSKWVFELKKKTFIKLRMSIMILNDIVFVSSVTFRIFQWSGFLNTLFDELMTCFFWVLISFRLTLVCFGKLKYEPD